MASDIVSPSTTVQYLDNISVQLLFSGSSATGQFFIDGSLDNVNWVPLDIFPAMYASDADKQILIDMNNISFSNIRVRYAHAPGDTGSLTAIIEGKSI
jgi:hypothetical protein